ncbi:MAG TPA: TlyA family RNA methyltransferase [Methylomirabilota bacterium]|nr:TlyA family RNA methyltransferase [Methylomirabilota bacterium]
MSTVAARGAKMRLDAALVARALAPSREKAARLILAGEVKVDGHRVDKAGARVAPGSRIDVAAPPRYVSRGGDKLAHALRAFGVDPRDRVCLDVGASTGGFTHCLLDQGAARVYAVDVGAHQLHARLRTDPRVVVLDRKNARNLVPSDLAEVPTLATVDVSFISLDRVLPAVFGILEQGDEKRGEVVALVKPQFEVGKGQVGKGGVVRDPARHRDVLTRVAAMAGAQGWSPRGVARSPLRGPAGNREFFLHLMRGAALTDLDTRIERETAAEEAP